jgi:FkbM family methyltransferase
LFSELTGSQGAVVAFEPVPKNAGFLHHHVAINGCNNVVVHELALADLDGMIGFDLGQSNSQGHLSESGSLLVQCARIDSLVAALAVPPPDIMKIDVEGAEVAVLNGASQVLARNKPIIFLATHGQEQHGECCRIFERLGYRLAAIGESEVENCDEIIALPQ